MRISLSVLGLALSMLAGAAQAQSCNCNGGQQVTNTGANAALTSLLSGNTMCVGSAPNWDYQEQHRAGGELWDFKRGTSTVDPTSKVGSWAIAGNGGSTSLTHTYTGGTSTSFKVCQVGSSTNYGLCQGNSNTSSFIFTVRTGITGC